MASSTRTEVSRGSLQLPSETVHYAVICSARARHLRLRIMPDSLVEIIVPKGSRMPNPRAILSDHESWILRYLNRNRDSERPDPERIVYLGKEYRLAVAHSFLGQAAVVLGAQELRVTLPPGATVRASIESWYRDQARAVLHERVDHWSQVMATSYGRITVRDQRTRWASCSRTGNLSFSWRLVMAPSAVLDYVVIHELMHTKEFHHGPRFWEGVALFCPDYNEHRAWLRLHGPALGHRHTPAA